MYHLLINISSFQNDWQAVKEVGNLMHKHAIQVTKAEASIEVPQQNKCTFVTADKDNENWEKIHSYATGIFKQLQDKGCIIYKCGVHCMRLWSIIDSVQDTPEAHVQFHDVPEETVDRLPLHRFFYVCITQSL
jgi:hypothetical protein